jgi:Sulfate permease and related transporters (MFS superfamily)
MKKIKELIPILEWLPNYNSSRLKGDFIAGITVSIILIPQGIAYALIAAYLQSTFILCFGSPTCVRNIWFF